MRLALALVGTVFLAGCATTPAGSSAPAAVTHDVTIEGSRVYPESITSDARGNLYNASTPGTIYRTLAGEGVARPWIVPGPANGLKSVFGVYADDKRGLLWVCTNPNSFNRETGLSALKAFDLATGALKHSYDFPGGAPAACNDIVVGDDGTTWATETSGGRIFVLKPGASALELYAASQALVGIDGISIAGDGQVYINNVRQNLLQRVLRNADGSFAGLSNLATSAPMGGPDGLRWLGGNRFIQGEGSSGRVTLVDIAGDAATLTLVAEGLDGPVGVTVVGDHAYVVEGKIGYLFNPDLRDKNPDPFLIRAIKLP